MKRILLILMCVTLSASPLYALSEDVKLDMLKSRLAQELKGAEYKKALVTIADLKATNIKLPESFDFFEGKALFESGDKAGAYKVLEKYVEKNGKEAKYYKQAVSYLVNAEPAYLAEVSVEKARKEAQLKRQREKEAEKQRIAAEQDAIKRKNDQFLNDALEVAKNRKFISDKATGLMWSEIVFNEHRFNEAKTNPYIQYELKENQAPKYCEALNLGGFDDWRVPTMHEFSTIYAKNKRAAPLGIDWDKTTECVWVRGSDQFWGYEGRRYKNDKIYLMCEYFTVPVWGRGNTPTGTPFCVRTESADKFNDFFDHEFTVFAKNGRSLMVEDTLYSSVKTFQNSRDENFSLPFNLARKPNFESAQSYCSSLKLAGYNDWRLPTTDDFINVLPCKFESQLHFPHGVILAEDMWGVDKDSFFASPVFLNVSECRVKAENKKSYIYHNVRCVRDVKK